MLNTYFDKNVPEIQGLLNDSEKTSKNNGRYFFFSNFERQNGLIWAEDSKQNR